MEGKAGLKTFDPQAKQQIGKLKDGGIIRWNTRKSRSEVVVLETLKPAPWEDIEVPCVAHAIYTNKEVTVITTQCKRVVLFYKKAGIDWSLTVYIGIAKQIQDIANALFTQERLTNVTLTKQAN